MGGRDGSRDLRMSGWKRQGRLVAGGEGGKDKDDQ
jgi:hypothetical protein